MQCAVTGSAGHVGANMVRRLLEKGHQVRAVTFNDTRALQGLDGVEMFRADVLDSPTLEAAFDGIEVVFNLAAVIAIVGGEHHMDRVNIEGARNVAEACLSCGVDRLVHFSSIHAFSHLPKDEPVSETRGPAEPDAMHYDRTKARGELEVLAVGRRGLHVVIVNPTAILGPHDYKPSHMGQVLLDLHRRIFPALVDGGFDWVDVRDVVDGAIQAAELGGSGERYLLSGKRASFQELARTVEETTGVKAPRWVSPMWLAHVGAPFAVAFNRMRGRRPLYTNSSLRTLCHHQDVVSTKAGEAFGYKPRPLAETIRDTFGWFSDNGLL